MSTIQFGWSIPPAPGHTDRATYINAIRNGLASIEGHFDSVWFSDHLQFEDEDWLEGWTTLTYLAAMNPNFYYGHTVLSAVFRNPAHLAKMAATLQYMSQGHFILGMGASPNWSQAECEAYGIPFPAPKQRVEALEETLQIIKTMWKGEATTFNGTYHSIKEAYCRPTPEPEPQVMIASFGPKMMRLCARYADGWIGPGSDLATLKTYLNALDKACEDIGRDPHSLQRTLEIGEVYCAPTEQEVQALIGDRELEPETLVGMPEQISTKLQQMVDLGITSFILGSGAFPDLSSLETIARHVIPNFNRK